MTRAAVVLAALVACGGRSAPRGADVTVVTEGARLRWEDPLPAKTAITTSDRKISTSGAIGLTLFMELLQHARVELHPAPPSHYLTNIMVDASLTRHLG